MKDKELKQILQTGRKPEIDSSRKEEAIRGVLAAGGNLRGMPRISIWQRMYTMAGYLSPWLWIVQGAVVLLCAYSLAVNGRGMMPTIAAAVPLIGCIGFVELQKGYACGMQELESACRYDNRQVILLKLLLIGSADMLLTLFLFALSTRLGVGLPEAVLYILVPYLLSCALYFAILLRTNRRVSNVGLLAAGIFLAVAFQFVFENIDLDNWVIRSDDSRWVFGMTVTAAALLILAIRKFWKRIDREDTKIWSFD